MTTPAELAGRWAAAADELGLFFANEPDVKVDAALAQMRQNLVREFLKLFPKAPPGTMADGVDCIIAQIQSRRRALEVAGSAPSVNYMADLLTLIADILGREAMLAIRFMVWGMHAALA